MKAWLKLRLSQSTANFKLVLMHHAPYTTAQKDEPATWMRWPFKDWGASAVLAGHQHAYERLLVDELLYIVNGLGGHPWLYNIAGMSQPYQCTPHPGSEMRYNDAHGAILGATDS